MDKFLAWFKSIKGISHTPTRAARPKSKSSNHGVEPVVMDYSSLNSLPNESFETTDEGVVHWKTIFSSPRTKTNTLTVGIATCPPGNGHLACHRHSQAEVYYIISGRGVLTIDGREHAVYAGSVVFIPGDAEHGIRNSDEKEDLRWLYSFAVDGFEDIIYRF